jgi:hypothetical protein
MSDLSTLSHEYAANALFADEVNTLILMLKKFFLKTRGKEGISNEEISKTREKLIELLEGILVELNPKSLDSETIKKRSGLIPLEVIEKIRGQYRNEPVYLVEDINELIDRLKYDKQIDSSGFELLDTLCDAADNITSTSFRRFWRR